MSRLRPDPAAEPAAAGSATAFFALAFAFTWALQVPAVLGQQGVLPGDPDSYLPLAVVGIFGPMVAAVVLTARTSGRAGVRALFGSLRRWRVGWRWYAMALLVPGLLLALGLQLLTFAGYEGSPLWLPGADRILAIPLIAIAEETGWRGYALPHLERRHGAFVASVILGVLWALWHIPMFVGQGIPLSTLPVMLLFFVGGSLLFTWIYVRSGRSLLLAVLAHVGAHLNNAHMALPGDAVPMWVSTVVYAGLGFGAVCFDREVFGRIARSGPGEPRR